MSNLESLETLDDGEPPSLRSWNDSECDTIDGEYEMLRQEYQKREITYLNSIGIEHPKEWVREMNIPSAQRMSEAAPIETKRRIGRKFVQRIFRISSI